MKQLHIYIDTSVIGGCFDEEFATTSRRLFGAIQQGRAIVVVSPITTREIEGAPAPVRQVLQDLPSGAVLPLENSEEVDHLTHAYIQAKVVGERFRADAAHIAFTTVYLADVLVSWNFRHIVNLNRIHQLMP